jgi:hypothetical protein
VVLYGIASALSGDIEGWYQTSEEAEVVLADIIRDEPALDGQLWVKALEFEQSVN